MQSLTAPRQIAEGRSPVSESVPDKVVELDDVSLDYGSHRVLDGFSLTVNRGELVALLGPSGSGKTTVIRTVAGFLSPSAGHVRLSGRDVTRVPSHRRGVGVVFQSYALFPHMTVAENLAYSLKVKKWNRAKIRQRCAELLELVQLEGHAEKKPSRLSGGQQQRVALARALAMDPEVLLLDEPLSNLDANLRRDVGKEIRRLQQRTGTTAIMVTHDRQEAFGMADRIAVLRDGRIEQLGTPHDLYRRPSTRFMATFVGDANLIPGRVTGGRRPDGLLSVSNGLGQLLGHGVAADGEAVHVLIRPEDIQIHQEPGVDTLKAAVVETQYFGNSVVTMVEVAGQPLSVVTSGSAASAPEPGSSVWLTVDPHYCTVLDSGGA
jgi:ABC-type Fe3+/spermidine/putrescine transport system ATPase subunit